MGIISVKLTDITAAPWRFSEDRAVPHETTRTYTRILENIVQSLQKDGQFAPIHIRPNHKLSEPISPVALARTVYEVVDGHIVVDAARQLGFTHIDAVVHHMLDDEKARLRYIHMNLNRCGQYGHYHVKVYRVMGAVSGVDAKAKAALLMSHTAWPPDRVVDYVELDERSDNWQRFMFVPKSEGDQLDIYADVEPAPVPNNQ